MDEQCLCGNRRPLARCCGPYLAGDAIAPTAEALMRSRYSAFCQGNIDYLMATHQPIEARTSDRANLSKTIRTTRWQNLSIVATRKGQKKDKTGVVEFVAAYQNLPQRSARLLSVESSSDSGVSDNQSPLQQLHEKSRFVKEKGQWFYTDGDILPPYNPSPSALCWCGSGKKFKRCHD